MTKTCQSIIFDTSALRKISLFNLPAEVRLLSDLSSQGKVELIIPHVVWEEWFSQIEINYEKIIGESVKSLQKLSSRPWLTNSMYSARIVGQCDNLIKELCTFEKVCIGDTMGMARELGFKKIELLNQDALAILEDYFAGNPPFKNAKSREDFPDAFILSQIRQLSSSRIGCIVVVADKQLQNAVDSIGVETVPGLKELLVHSRVSALNVNRDYALWWVRNFGKLLKWLGSREEELSVAIEGSVFDSVINSHFSHHTFPNSVLSAEVAEVEQIRNVEYLWELAASIGEGIFTVPISFDVDCVIHAWIHALDLGSEPEWFDIDDNVIESDGFCSATGECTVSYNADLVIKYNSDFKMGIAFEAPESIGLEEVVFQDLYA